MITIKLENTQQIKKLYTLLILSLVTHFTIAQQISNDYLEYIRKYSSIAVRQQKEYGIPASITLAQGLLESGAGKSAFAIESNNHFGIKCTDWTGEKIYHDDDKNGECFRKYTQVIESYEDHSRFLKNRKRYALLFDLLPTDYKGWAGGLKKLGYATDPQYDTKLIALIELYQLHQYDLGKENFNDLMNGLSSAQQSQITNNTDEKSSSMGVVPDISTHKILKINGLKFIIVSSADTYESIAKEFDIEIYKLLFFNDLNSPVKLLNGDKVFLHSKNDKADEDNATHQVQDGESMQKISQLYGIKVVKLYDMNKIPYDKVPKVGQILKLR